MPLRDPNSVAFAPYWNRSNALAQADINNLMYNNQMQMAQPMYQRPGGKPARTRTAQPALSPQQRIANARRIAAARRGGVAPAYAPQQSAPVQGTPSQLANTYQEQIDAANAANEERYKDILQGYRSREEMAREQATLAGDQQYRDESARVRNDLIGRGLANSSLLGRGLFDAYERKAQNQLNVDLQTSGDRLAFQERRNDVGPDYSQMLQLAQLQGQTQAFQNQDLQGLLGEIGTAVDQRVGAGNQPSYGGQSRAQAAAQMNYALQGGAPFMMQGGGYQVPNLMGMNFRGGGGGGYPMMPRYQGGPIPFAGVQGQGGNQVNRDLLLRLQRAQWLQNNRPETGSRRRNRIGNTNPYLASTGGYAGAPTTSAGGLNQPVQGGFAPMPVDNFAQGSPAQPASTYTEPTFAPDPNSMRYWNPPQQPRVQRPNVVSLTPGNAQGLGYLNPQGYSIDGTSDAPPSTQPRRGVTAPSRPWATNKPFGTTYTQQPVPRRM